MILKEKIKNSKNQEKDSKEIEINREEIENAIRKLFIFLSR